nr:unnamed protein product [Callosobruchus analis]
MLHFISSDIDYEGFHKFIDTFLEVRTPEELCRHLFLSFMKRSEPKNIEGKAFKEMTVLSSTTACAPVTSHNKGVACFLMLNFHMALSINLTKMRYVMRVYQYITRLVL